MNKPKGAEAPFSRAFYRHQLNDNLQHQMQMLFDFWFTQFDFPDENGKPYRSSGGAMVWNNQLKCQIPKDWSVTTLENLIDVYQTRISSNDINGRVYIPIEVIPRHKISFSDTADLEKANSGLCLFNRKDILLSNRRVYFHKVCISPFSGITRDTVITTRPKNTENLGYVFMRLFSDHFIKYATINSVGSEQPVLSPTTVLNYKVPHPTRGLDLKYSSFVDKYIDLILCNEQSSRELVALRDTLLPLLMNGQTTISD